MKRSDTSSRMTSVGVPCIPKIIIIAIVDKAYS